MSAKDDIGGVVRNGLPTHASLQTVRPTFPHMYSKERLFVSAVALSLPAVIIAQVAAALLCAAAGHRDASCAAHVAVFTLLAVAVLAWACRRSCRREHAGRKLALVAVSVAALAWIVMAGTTGHPIAGLFRPGVAISTVVLLAVSLGISVLLPRLAAGLPQALDGALSRRRGLTIVWVLGTLLAVAQGARLSIFMVDASQTWASAVPPSPRAIHHQCLAAYVRAAELNRRGVADLWDPAHYPDARKLAPSPGNTPPASSVEQLAPYLDDRYLYPPMFLPAPRAALAITNSYRDIRAMFFGLNALGFLLGTFALVHWIGGRAGLGAGLLLPVTWLHIATLLTLQFGQAHLLVVVLAVSGMVLIEKGRPAVGGLLLATATCTKIFPGVLILYLVARRQWRAVAWTLASTSLLVLATLAAFGLPTFEAFFYDHLPRLVSGEATRSAEGGSLALVMNGTIQAIPDKLRDLGVPIAENVGWFFSLAYVGLIVVLVLVAARRGRQRRDRAAHWLAILLTASLSGPIAPVAYAFVPGVWLLTLFPAVGRRRVAWTVFLVFAFLAFSPIPPITPGRALMAWSLAGPLVAVGLSVWVVFRRAPRVARWRNVAQPATPNTNTK